MATLDRLLALKIVTYKTQRNNFARPDLARELRRAKQHALPVSEKHFPPVSMLKRGKRAAFINKITDLGKNRGVIVEVCTYVHGVFPENVAVPFLQEELDLDVLQQKLAAATPKKSSPEAIYRFRALIYGDAVVMEKAPNTSGMQSLSHALRCVLKKMLNDPAHPVPHLMDVGSEKLSNIIKSKGGVERVTASLIVPKKSSSNRFAKLLSESKKGISGAEKVQITWVAGDGGLGATDVAELYDAFEDDEGPSQVKIHFPGGTSVTELSHYREQDRYPIGCDSFGRPYATEVHEALQSYLSKLRDPKGAGPLTADGQLKNGYYLAGSEDED